jgi:glycosyltransferase involved in cell wall biosynthesis
MWPFTGGCHYDDECGKYAVACGACPVLQSSKEEDLSRSVFRRKSAAWADRDITVVATSKWLRDCAASSALFGRRRIEVLPNCVDTHTYRPLDKAVVRRLFGLDEHAKTVLFSGGSAHKDPRKGLRHLFDALAMLGRDRTSPLNAQVMLLGIPDDAVLPDCPFPIKRLDYLQDEVSQAALYNTADVLVAPSVQENLSNVVVESVCCGTPVVAFDIGGMPDIITPGQTGYLARPFSAASLAEGIHAILDSDTRAASELSQRCRQLAVSRYSEAVVARQYLDLYADVIAKSGAQQRVHG